MLWGRDYLEAEACPVCGTPQHGMSQPDLLLTLDVDADPSQEDFRIGRKRSKPLSRKRAVNGLKPCKAPDLSSLCIFIN